MESQFSNQSLGALFGAGGMLEKAPGLILQLATAYLIQGAQHMRIPLIAEVLGDVKSTRIRTSLLSALDLFRFIGSAVAINERDPRIPNSLLSLLTASIARKHLPACRKWVSDTLIPKLKEAEEAHVLPQADDAVKHMCVTLMRRHLLSEERKHEFTALLRNVISAPSQWSEEHLMPVLPDLEKFKEEWKELAYQLGAEVRVTLALHGLAKILPEVLEVLEKALDEPYASLVT